MKNILLLYGTEDKYISWRDYFEDYYFIKTKDNKITNRDIKLFFKNKSIVNSSEDNLFVINNNLIINNDLFTNNIDYITNLLKKDHFCYLWNFMQKCKKLKEKEKNRDLVFYQSETATEFYAVAANFKFWYNILLRKDKSISPHLLLQDKLNDKIVFSWPTIFNFPLSDIKDNYLLTSMCQENYNAVPLKTNDNKIAKILFALICVIIITFLYFFWKKIPKPRYFYVKYNDHFN